MTLGKRWERFARALWKSLKDFLREDGLDKASILAYFSIFSTLFLLTFLTFLFTRFLGNPDRYLTSFYPFSPDFTSKISPDFFIKAKEFSGTIQQIGVLGIGLSLFLGILVFKKVIQFVNEMFHIRLARGFLFKRFKEFALMFFIGLFFVASFAMTGFISTVTGLFQHNTFIAEHISPVFIESINQFLLKYLLPVAITFSLFFLLYKWIPERHVRTRAAWIAALVSSLMWEVVKRGYAYYLVNLSIIGRIQGPIIAIILFGFWMEASTAILLYGAKLTFNLDRNP
ncbi:MAG TPA: YihY/virulence factor BrkB family protein [Candidatus Aminicenantes bacterium]|nr:YihY/virulence factor BrkB family protein [Candidatus Aminicenantes bacterium]